jgi:hypothetical protein
MPEIQEIQESPGDVGAAPEDRALVLLPNSSSQEGGSSHRKNRWSCSRTINRNDLPPAFRASLANPLFASNTAATAATNLAVQHPRSPGGKKYHRRPSKLHRKWPPVFRKNNPGRMQKELLHSTLNHLRSMARVKSQIGSFEPPLQQTASSLHPAPAAAADDILEEEENDPEEPLSNAPPSSSQHNTPPVPPSEAMNNAGETTSAENETEEAVPAGGLASALKSALKSGKCKGSLRIRWRGPEVFFIEARSRRKHFQPMYFDDLLEDRFKSSGSDHDGSLGSLLADRFGGAARPGGGDSCPSHPNRPPRRYEDEWSDSEHDSVADLMLDLHGDGDKSITVDASLQDDTVKDEPLPADPPAIWITVLENDSAAGGLQWRVLRVWDNAILDSREKERIVADEDLMNMVKNLSGLPAIPTANLLNEKSNNGTEANNEEEDVEDDDDSFDLSNWCIKKFYDIDGEIVDELQMSERSLNEESMLSEIMALAREATIVASATGEPTTTVTGISPPPPPVESPIENKWNASPVDVKQDVPVSKAIESAMEHRKDSSVHRPIYVSSFSGDESISVLEMDEGPSQHQYHPTAAAGISLSSFAELDDSTTAVPTSSLEAMAHDKINKHYSGDEAAKSATIAPTKDIIPNDCPPPPPAAAADEVVVETPVEMTVVPSLKITVKKNKKKKRKNHGTLADLLSPPGITTFHGMSP